MLVAKNKNRPNIAETRSRRWIRRLVWCFCCHVKLHFHTHTHTRTPAIYAPFTIRVGIRMSHYIRIRYPLSYGIRLYVIIISYSLYRFLQREHKNSSTGTHSPSSLTECLSIQEMMCAFVCPNMCIYSLVCVLFRFFFNFLVFDPHTIVMVLNVVAHIWKPIRMWLYSVADIVCRAYTTSL